MPQQIKFLVHPHGHWVDTAACDSSPWEVEPWDAWSKLAR